MKKLANKKPLAKTQIQTLTKMTSHGSIDVHTFSHIRTLTLEDAAELLKIHPQTLRKKAMLGEIPGAKLGKSWVFIEEDLANHIRSNYISDGRTSNDGGTTSCSTDVQMVKYSGVASPHQMEKRYAELLKLPTKERPRSLKTD
jgi:excisionase family DNA binding protein